VNGNGKFFKWAAASLLSIVLVLISIGGAGMRSELNQRSEETAANRDTILSNARRIDSTNARIARHLDRHEVDQAKMMLQLAAIAEKLHVPVVVDTVQKDSVP